VIVLNTNNWTVIQAQLAKVNKAISTIRLGRSVFVDFRILMGSMRRNSTNPIEGSVERGARAARAGSNDKSAAARPNTATAPPSI
jgi:hypothetical protein